MPLQDYVKKTTLDDELEEQRKSALLEEMGLTTHDVEKLQATMLSPDEAVAAKAEELERVRKFKGQKDDWEEFVDAKRRMGRMMHHTEIIRRLRSALPSLVVSRGAQVGRISLYVTRNVPADEITDYRGSFKHVDCPIYISWLDLGLSPEYEIDLVNDVDVAVAQRRGWRTLLLRLHARRAAHCKLCQEGERPAHPNLKGRPTSLITEEQLYRVFPYPTNGPTASNFRKQLYEFRNGII